MRSGLVLRSDTTEVEVMGKVNFTRMGQLDLSTRLGSSLVLCEWIKN